MPAPGVHTENEDVALFLGAQIGAIRNAAYGLTEAQARETPCRSTLSIGGLITHAIYVMEGRLRRDAEGTRTTELTPEGFARFAGSFALAEDDTLEAALQRFDAAAEAYLASVRSADPDATSIEPPAPWDGVLEDTPTKERFYLLHHIEELARHAGHADIIREQIDGADGASLAAAAEGRPANDFVKPWSPPG
ncbi:DUF664 domain-containing protein [Allobranchiibius sp. GilTou38]|uniref:mycothiol transferase n=1 Tax=Allobranchiibius sp. GilTou38 TaxID=2815210 RepID=UPI001AA0D364|nr:DUF664 domain-containing protein [Allobranchiibius sp. GilTou38]MBO1767880.1 DUF664 domain-containing protein [Allobranchiibius sp. GilTou38]